MKHLNTKALQREYKKTREALERNAFAMTRANLGILEAAAGQDAGLRRVAEDLRTELCEQRIELRVQLLHIYERIEFLAMESMPEGSTVH